MAREVGGRREGESETPHSLLLRFALVSDLPLSRLQLTTARVAKEVNGSEVQELVIGIDYALTIN